jgi:hypothetical protein
MYNWWGNVAFRKELGSQMGFGLALESTPGFDPFAVEGMTRLSRVAAARRHAANGLFRLLPGSGQQWKEPAYRWFANFAKYSELAWGEIEKTWEGNQPDYDFLLDPDLFRGRRDQISIGIKNLRAMFPLPNESAQPVQGAISGEKILVDMHALLVTSPPQNLVDLMPTCFARNEDVDGLKKVYSSRNQVLITYDDIDGRHNCVSSDDPGKAGSSVGVVVDLKDESVGQGILRDLHSKRGSLKDAVAKNLHKAGVRTARDKLNFEFRNYLWGRAVMWNADVYSKFMAHADTGGRSVELSDGVDVAKVQRILDEVRGGRAAMNSLAIFVK